MHLAAVFACPPVLALCVCAALILPAAAQDPASPAPAASPVPAPSVHWHRIEIAGQRVGHAVTRLEHVQQGSELLLRYIEAGSLNMGRLGAAVEIETETIYLERLDGTLVQCTSVADMSNRETRTKVVFEGTTAHITTTTAGQTRETRREVPEEMIGPMAGRRELVKNLGKTGTDFWVTTWVNDFSDAIDIDVQVGEPEEVTVGDGSTRRLVRVTKVMDGMPMEVVGWHDENGMEQVSRVKTSGIEIVTYLTSQADALAEAEGDAADVPDVFAATMVFEPYQVPAARRVGRALVRVAGREGKIPMPIPESSAQRLVRGDAAEGRELLFEIQTREPLPGHAGRRPVAADELPEEVRVYLGANSSIQSDDPRIVAKAQEIVGDEADAWAAAQKLEAWVEDHVSAKGMDVAWASSLEVFEDQTGDCSEHAVLLAAMCRAAGIPSRVAMGSLYIGGVWAGHAWNQVWIDGEWYALDATLGMGHADAMRLTLGTMSLDDGAGSREFAGLAGNLGGLSIETLEIGNGLDALRPAEAHGHIVDGEYVDRLFGLRFRLPEGVPVVIRQPGRTISFDLLDTDPKNDDSPLDFRLRAYEAEVDGSAPSFLPLDKGEKIEIDGRPAWSFERGDERGYVVLSGGTAFEFRFQDVEGDGDEAAVEAVMASVDFDLVR